MTLTLEIKRGNPVIVTRVAIVGLKGVGKSSLIYKMSGDYTLEKEIAMGFSVHSIQLDNIKFITYDLEADEHFRELVWPRFVKMVDIVIYVIDGSDRHHIDETLKCLTKITKAVTNDQLLVVLINKVDLGTYIREERIMKVLKKYNRNCSNTIVSYISMLSSKSVTSVFYQIVNHLKQYKLHGLNYSYRKKLAIY